MGKKVISFQLSTRELNRAIKKITNYKQEFIRKTELFREKVAERLADQVKKGFNGAIVDDLIQGESRVADVDVYIDNRDSITVVIAKGKDAIWVEFGAGVYHNGSPDSSPHPRGTELGLTIGGYGKGNGKKEVWGFYENGELKLTHGTSARMPMTLAVTTICNDIQNIAKEVFR